MHALPSVLTGLCLVLAYSTCRCTGGRVLASPVKDATVEEISLQGALAATGLDQPDILSSTLHELGLSSLHKIRMLNAPEQLELAESLKVSGVNLGSRSLLRHLAFGGGVFAADFMPAAAKPFATTRRAQDQEGTKGDPSNSGSGPSADSLAIAVTFLMGIGG